MTQRVLVLGTRNAKKRRELTILLEGTGIVPATLDQFPESIEVEETGSTFEENARLKATLQAARLGQWVLGEDSGLCVEALGGAPGVLSARYSGPEANDARNNEALLEALRGVPKQKRGAHYVCHMTLANPQGQVIVDVEERCHGRIIESAAGVGGFGYDPYFEIPEYHRTFGELGDAVKSVLSHRARAMRRFLPAVRELIASGQWP